MPSRVFMPGMMPLTVVENPDVVERIINDARDDPSHDSAFVELRHMAVVRKVEDVTPEGDPIISDPYDSFADLKVRYEGVMAVRGFHEEEEP